jgi:hypothetical protein
MFLEVKIVGFTVGWAQIQVTSLQDQWNEAHFQVQLTTSKLEGLRVTSHTSQGPWPCTCEGSRFSSKGCTTNMACQNSCQTYFLEVGLNANFDITLFVVCHVRIHVDFASKIKKELPLGLHLLVWSELEQSQPFRPMRHLRMQSSWAFSLVCEVALRPYLGLFYLHCFEWIRK